MKSVVLLSSGLDSTVNLHQAKKEGSVLLALTFDYGQRAAKKEIISAKKIAKFLQVSHKVIRLPFFKNLGKSSLLDTTQSVPSGKNVQIDNLKRSQKTAKSVWVPNRNGIFLNIAAGFAESMGANFVIPGFNIEEAATFPDNSSGFLKTLDQSFSFSTSNQVKTHCFTTSLNKTEIVKLGVKLKVKWELLWPCYHGGKKWCGKCESCLRSKRAFLAARISTEKYYLE